MKLLTINAEDWYNGFIPAEDKGWDRLEYRVDKMLVPMLDELDKHHVRAVVFCTGWLAEKHPEMVREIARRGHMIGCNGYWHIEPLTMSIEEFREDTKKAKEILEEVSGQKVKAFRAANFSMDEERLGVMAELGFQYDSSLFGSEPYKVSDGFKGVQKGSESSEGLMEYPVAKYKGKIPFSGGGFFRLMPYWLIRKAMKEMPYVMTYFHPRDFDKDMPLWPGLSAKAKFLTTVGVASAYGKWLKMMNDFEFVNIEQAKI